MTADGRLTFQPGNVAESIWKDGHWKQFLCSFFSVSLCTPSVPLPVFLQRIINSVTACSKAPCLVVHIQSCRLKQIAICMPLGGGEKKQREAPFFIPSLHLAEYSLFEAPNVCFSPPPAVTVKVRAITAIRASSCQADWEVAAKTKE